MRCPYDTYVGIQLLWGASERKIAQDIITFDLPFAIPKSVRRQSNLDDPTKVFLTLRDYIRTVRMRVPALIINGAIPPPALDWARRQFIDPDLLEPDNDRVSRSCDICQIPELRHILQVCLIDPRRRTWEDIMEALAGYGSKIDGLTPDAIFDFQQLFWCFDGIPPAAREVFLEEVGASSGIMLANKGRADVGLAIDLGIPLVISDLDRYTYMRELAFLRYVKGMHNESITANGAVALIDAVLSLDQVIGRAEEESRLSDETGSLQAIFEVEEAHIPTIDHVFDQDQESEDAEPASSVIALRGN